MRDAFIELLRLEAVKNKNIILLTGDLGFGVLDKYRETIPEQFLNIGIAEQNMTGAAVGLALEGFKVFTYSIGNFCTLRCLEQIRYDVCHHDVDVKIISIGSGLGYGSLGASHHATEDVAILRALPNMTIYTPSDYDEVCAVVQDLINTRGPGYIRLPKIKIEHNKNIKPNKKLTKIQAQSLEEDEELARKISNMEENGSSNALYENPLENEGIPQNILKLIYNILHIIRTMGFGHLNEQRFLYYIIYRFSLIKPITKEFLIYKCRVFEFLCLLLERSFSTKSYSQKDIIDSMDKGLYTV